MNDIIKYKKIFPETKIVIDQHGDYINTPVNSLRKKIINKYIPRIPVRILAKYADKIWGVTPLRVKYLTDVLVYLHQIRICLLWVGMMTKYILIKLLK